MDTKLLGSSLMEKWAVKESGLKSSLLTTSTKTSTSSTLQTKGQSTEEERKRKLASKKSGKDAKKLATGKSELKSSLLSSPSLQSSLLTDSKVGILQSSSPKPSSLGLKTSSKLTSSGLQSSLLLKREEPSQNKSLAGGTAQRSHSAKLSTLTSSSLTSSSLMSSLLKTTPSEQRTDKLKSTLTDNLSFLPTKSARSHIQTTVTTRPISKGTSRDEKPKRDRGTKRAAPKENVFAVKKHTIKAPRYNLEGSVHDGEGIVIPNFVSPVKDPSLSEIRAPLHDVNGLKLALINAVSGSLICQPNFKDSKDLTRRTLTTMSESVIQYDPEFVLKVALFTRKELNVRTTANFLLALAANIHPCRPFLKKYYCASIALPSDWIEVAEIYQAFHDRTINQGSLPAALRKVMIMKFPDFDKYQLAKYNKESSMKKKKKKEKATDETQPSAGVRGRGRGRGRGRVARGGFGAARGRGGTRPNIHQSDSDSDSDSSDEDDDKLTRQISGVEYDEDRESQEQLSQMRFSLKQLIRKLHITEPVEHVMCLIGKKYPTTLEAFYQARLPGTWEEERAGKRMKLPVPETWETQVSLKGNKASTWEDLIDHKKLPFMAMLRNLRNLIRAGISQKHHNQIIRRLTDERQVANSKQFPFRFFSAYEVLGQLKDEYEKSQAALVAEAEKEAFSSSVGVRPARGRGRGRGRGHGKGEQWWLEKREKKQADKSKAKETAFDLPLISRYRKALDTAVKIATVYNVQPIKGRTIVLCDVGPNMEVNCTAARGLGKPRTMLEVALLMGLMCKYSCEECDLVTFHSNTWELLSIEKGTILDNLELILNQLQNPSLGSTSVKQMPYGLPEAILNDALRDRIQVDNIVLLSGGTKIHDQNKFMSAYLKKYRQLVNPNLLYVNISFAGKNCGFSESIKPEHDNDIFISGFSDAILRFIAERGEGGQLMHVEKIDEAFSLKAMATSALEKVPKPVISPEKALPIVSNTPRWRTVRVFISSTFKDMHGERDVLTRFVFPELRALGKKHFINVHEVDLRWGVTEEESKSNKTLELCLSEIKKCQFFIGILGSRYGYVPDKYDVPDTQEYQWLKTYPAGASVTELEMHSGALCEPKKLGKNAFFYLRDPEFQRSIPKEFRSDFVSEADTQKLESLKTRVRTSGLEVYDMYPCTWGGIVDGKPIVAGLDSFALRVLNNLWTAIQQQYPDESALVDDSTHIQKLHSAMVEKHTANFVGRKALIKECIKHIQEIKSGILMLTGKPGTGKTAFVSAFVQAYLDSPVCDGPYTMLIHMVGAAPGSTNILTTLRRLCFEIRRLFQLDTVIPEDMKNVTQKFGELLKEAGSLCRSPLMVVIDGIDMMEATHQAYNMEWLPNPVPNNVMFVISAVEGGKCHQALKRHKPTEVTIGGLDMFDKADVIRNNLAVYGKALNETPFNNQMKLLLSKREAVNPLFLQLACEELRVFGVFEKVGEKLKSMPHTTPLLLQEVLTRLESDLGLETVSTAMSLLACVRDGLEREELREVLSIKELLQTTKLSVDDIYNVQLTPGKMVPPAMFSYLQRSLQTFLSPTESGSEYRMTLAHVEITAAVKQRYMKGVEHEQSFHKLLAGYFYQKADPTHNNTFHSNDVRAFSQLAYHLSLAGEFQTLGQLLTNLHYINNKCKLGLAAQLLEDYQEKVVTSKVSEREQNKMLISPKVQEFKMFVSRHLHIINKHPALTWQQAMNEPKGSEPQTAAAQIQGGLMSSRCYMEWENKPTAVDPNYMTISNLPYPVTSVAISSDNKYFACGGLDCLVRLYCLETGKELRMFRGHADIITGICFAGRSMLCSASLDNSISVWHVEDGHRIHLLKKHSRRVQSCASDPAGQHLASASWDCTVIVWNLAKGENVCELKLGSPVNSVAFHPEGQLIVTGCWDATIKIYDTFHKTRKAVLRGHQSSVRDVAYSPSGRHIASAALDGEVKLWAAYSGTLVGNITGHSLPINKLIFTPTGKELVTVSDDHKVKVWSGHMGTPLNSFGMEEDGPAKSVALSPDGEILAVGYHEGFIKLYSTVTGFEIGRINAHKASVNCLTFTPTGKDIVTGSANGESFMYRVSDLMKTGQYGQNTSAVLCVAVNVRIIAIGLEDCSCHVYFKEEKRDFIKPEAILRGQVGPITSICFSPDTNRLATASRDSSVYIWDTYGSMLAQVPEPTQKLHACHSDWITDCKWSNTGEYLVTSSTDFNLKVWDLKTGKEKAKLTGHMASINHIAYKFGCIVSTCSDGSVKVWSHKGTEITTLYGHSQCVNGCDLMVKVSKDTVVEKEQDVSDWGADPDPMEEKQGGERKKQTQIKVEDVIVATCGDDGTARLWRPMQANELASLTGHSDRVVSVASDTQGHLCSSSLDKSVKLWKPQLTTEKTCSGHSTEITFSVVSPDQSLLLTGSRDGLLKIWSLSTPEVLPLEVKAHDKSCNTGCFLDNKVFVTGGDDSKICVWNVKISDGKISRLTKTKSYTTESPVTCLLHRTMSRPGRLFMSCEWDGTVKAWTTEKDKPISACDVTKGNFKWLLKVCGGLSTSVVVTSSDKMVGLLDLQSLLSSKSEDRLTMRMIHRAEIRSLQGEQKNIPEHKRQNNMVLDCVAIGNTLLFVDSEGQITSSSADSLKINNSLKIHAEAVTSVQVTGRLMFTASKDDTIKVWRIEDRLLKYNDAVLHENLHQIGLFYCPAPVMCLQLIQTSPTQIRLVCGDQLGSVHFLSWNTTL